MRFRLSTGHRTIVSLLALSLATGPGVPAWAGDRDPVIGSEGRYVLNDGRIFHFRQSAGTDGGLDIQGGSGSLSVVITRVIGAGDPNAAASHEDGFVFSEVPSPSDFVVLGSDPWEATAATGTSPADLDESREVVSWTVSASPGSITSAYVVGADRMTLTVPSTFAAGGPGAAAGPEPPALLEVNGLLAEIDPELLRQLSEGVVINNDPARIRETRSLEDLVNRLADRVSFVNALTGLHLFDNDWLVGDGGFGFFPQKSCVWPCLRCGGSALGLVGGAIATAAACGAIAPSAGASGILCGAGIAGTAGAGLVTMANCAGCFECLAEPAPEKPETPEQPGGPGGDCPEGCECCGEPTCDCEG